MATTTADTPFLWGSAGERLTAEQLKSRRAVADALIKAGTEGTPIKHWTQGLNRIAQGLLGGYESGQLDREERSIAAEDRRLMSRGLSMYFTPPGSADNPAGGSRPVSLDASQPVTQGGVSPAAAEPFSAAPGPQSGQIPGSAPILPSDAFTKTAAPYAGDNEAVAALKNALGPMESGNRYDITGPVHSRMGTPLGKYQIMSANLPQWSQEALGRTVTPQEFLKSPELQEQIAGHRMGKIIDQYGNLHDAASVWHSGRPLAQARAAGARDVNMSTSDYVNKTVGRMRGPLPGATQDDPTVAGNGPGVPLEYKAPAAPRIAAALSPFQGAPAGDEVPRLIQAGVLPEQIRPDYLAEMWKTQPTFRENVEKWRAENGGGALAMTQGLTPAMRRADAAATISREIAKGAQPRMRLSGSDPLYTPAEIAAQGEGASPADLPAQGGSLADLPAAGARPSAFFVPPAVSGGEPTIVPAPGEGVSKVAAALAKTGGVVPPASTEGTSKVAQALMGGQDRAGSRQAIIDMMTSPAASPRTQALGAALLQREVTEAQRGKWTMETLPDGTVGQRNSATDEFRVLRPGVSELDQQSKRLSIQKAQRDLEESKAPKTLTVKQPDGSDQILERQQDGSWAPIRMPPQDPNAPKASPKLTEAQSKDLNYYNRGIQALEAFEKDPNAYADGTQRMFSNVPMGGNYLTSEAFQKAQQSGRNVLASILRKDSGAAITPNEEEVYGRIFLPQPGDKPGTLAQKAEARRQALESIKLGLGTAEVLARGSALLNGDKQGPQGSSPTAQPSRDRPVRMIPLTPDVAQRARNAIARGAPADAVKKRLEAGGYDASGL